MAFERNEMRNVMGRKLVPLVFLGLVPPTLVSAQQTTDKPAVKRSGPVLPSDKSTDEESLTFPTTRDLSRSIVRRQYSPVEMNFPERSDEGVVNIDAFPKLDPTALSIPERAQTGPSATSRRPVASESVRVTSMLPDRNALILLGGVASILVARGLYLSRRRKREDWIRID